MRYPPIVAALVCLSIASVAYGHTSVGGGGSSSDPDADCLRWEAVVLSTTDGGVADGGGDASVDGGDASVDGGDAGTSDGGTTTVVAVKLVCVEHATMFGCSCAFAAERTSPAASGIVVAVGMLAAATRRRRKRRRPSDEVAS